MCSVIALCAVLLCYVQCYCVMCSAIVLCAVLLCYVQCYCACLMCSAPARCVFLQETQYCKCVVTMRTILLQYVVKSTKLWNFVESGSDLLGTVDRPTCYRVATDADTNNTLLCSVLNQLQFSQSEQLL